MNTKVSKLKPNIIHGCKISMFFVCVFLTACGDNSPEVVPPLLVPEAPQINQPKAFTGKLVTPGAEQVERYIKNGVYVSSIRTDEAASDNPIAVSAQSSNTQNVAQTYSVTNTIEANVDEADRIKYDGDYMYVAETGNVFLNQASVPKVRVLKRNPDFTLQNLDALSTSVSFDVVDGLFLHDNVLALIGINQVAYPTDSLSIGLQSYTNSRISLSFFDVSEPEQGQETIAYQIDGALLATRRLENDLYVVSSYYPLVDGLIPFAESNDDKLNNYNQISQIPMAELMPKLYKDGQSRALNTAGECYMPAQASVNDGYGQLISVTKIDLSAPDNMQTICMSTNALALYMSEQSLYLAGDINGEQTQFHKISLDSFDYAASGTVQGQLYGRSNPLFKMHESDGKFRVVSTDYTTGTPVHSLHILEQNGEDLTHLAVLPNDREPAAIGKPNEEVFAVRFVQNKAYVVTFENTDPLYVINLSDPANPFIEGSLEIPGFSSYIMPLENDLLLGVGQEVGLQILPEVGTSNATFFTTTIGLKLSLFDVRDPSDPTELTNIVIPDAFTPIEYNYKTLSALNQNGVYKFAFPYEQWGNFDQADNAVVDYYSSYKNSLLLLQTNTLDATPRLDVSHEVNVGMSDSFYYGPWESRSIIHGDKVYYLQGNQVWLSTFDGQGELLGPF